MIFTRSGYRWRVNDRGFLEMEFAGRWMLYGWLDLV